jgi:D-alanyl-D-alanine carboxypeptidase/D-alanyl-D-alanine-endopeptidase (penicillin-binding protein 4)
MAMPRHSTPALAVVAVLALVVVEARPAQPRAARRSSTLPRVASQSVARPNRMDSPTKSAGTGPRWHGRIDRRIAGKSFGIAVRIDGRTIYEYAPVVRRVPASNQKLLLSMAALDRFDPAMRLATNAATGRRRGHVITGNLWLSGSGDPAVGAGTRYGRKLSLGMTSLRVLAQRVVDSGIRRIRGRVMGSTGFFTHDWWAPGWKSDFPIYYVGLPSALTFNGNRAKGRFISDPERRAAVWMTRKLESLGVSVRHRAAAGVAPAGLRTVASINSKPLVTILRYMNFSSSNFVAEILGKRLGLARYGRPGTIAKGARAVRTWARRRDISIEASDSSGLSYRNRVSPRGLARLLDVVEERSWGPVLRRTLPPPDRGTLKDRLGGIPVRAKTGTLENISALSGWVRLRRTDRWASFSIMSSGLSKPRAVEIENKIVRTLYERAR